MQVPHEIILAGSGDSAHIREEPARFNYNVNLSDVTIVMQNLPEKQRNLPNKSITLVRGTCKISSMIRIVILGRLSSTFKKRM